LPAVAVGKAQAYLAEFEATIVGLLPELMQEMVAFPEFATVQDITPAGN